MEEIGQLYTKGSKKLGLAKHQMPLFSDERDQEQQGDTTDISQVVNRLRMEPPKCPHIVKVDL
ncbi:Hypothetical predicted protein, partial [Paramuricea clavata]